LAAFLGSFLHEGVDAVGYTLGTFLAEADISLRHRALAALADLGSQAAPHALEISVFLNDADVAVRTAAVVTLGALGTEAASPCASSMAVLLRDEDPMARAAAVKALGCLGHVSLSHKDRMAELLRDQEEDVRYAAAVGLSSIGYSAAESVVAQLQGATPGTLDAAAQALGQMGADVMADVLKLIQSREENACRTGARAVRHLGHVAAAAENSLALLLRHDCWEVRKEAALAIGALGPTARHAAPELAAALQDCDQVCRASVEALGGLREAAAGYAEDVALVLDRPDRHARRKATRALGRIVLPGTLTEQLASKLGARLVDDDGHVAAAAAEVFGSLGGEASAPHAARIVAMMGCGCTRWAGEGGSAAKSAAHRRRGGTA